jgi:hypothetical protein
MEKNKKINVFVNKLKSIGVDRHAITFFEAVDVNLMWRNKSMYKTEQENF